MLTVPDHLKDNPLAKELYSERKTILTPLTDTETAETLCVVAKLASGVEICFDTFTEHSEQYYQEQIERFRELGLPILGRFRIKEENGYWLAEDDDQEAERLELIQSVKPHLDGIDIECRTPLTLRAVACADESINQPLIIASVHHFEAMPSEAHIILAAQRAHKLGANIFKLAAVVSKEQEYDRFVTVSDELEKRGIGGLFVGTFKENEDKEFAHRTRREFPGSVSLATFAAIGKLYVSGQIGLEAQYSYFNN